MGKPEKMLERLSYDELKRKIPKERKGYLESLNVVNDNEKAIWLIDYWCNKDICGLFKCRFQDIGLCTQKPVCV